MTDLTETDSVLVDLKARRKAQYRKWGSSEHTAFEWLSILGEEFGEVCEAANALTWGQGTYEQVRYELIDLAAVAVAMVEDLDSKQ